MLATNILIIGDDFFNDVHNRQGEAELSHATIKTNNSPTAFNNKANNEANSVNIPKAIPFIDNDWKPRNISREATIKMLQRTNVKIIPFANDVIDMGYRIFAVCQQRGRCYYNTRVITIPTWSIAKGQIHADWYLSHELAHAYTRGDQHGSKFMRQLQLICPTESVHLELTYKKRNALAAGILPADF